MTLASALCAGMLAGCGSSASTGSTGDSGSTASDDAYNVTVIVKHTDGHFNKVIAGARAYGSEHDNVNVEIQSPTSATSYDEQVNMIETALGNPGIDAVVIAPQQSTSTATLVDTATKPVVALDTDFTSDKKACFVRTYRGPGARGGWASLGNAWCGRPWPALGSRAFAAGPVCPAVRVGCSERAEAFLPRSLPVFVCCT